MAFLDEVMVKQINTQAQEIHFRRALLTVLASILYAVGWITRKLFVVLWLTLTWSWAAIRLGWRDAGPKPTPKT